MNRVSYGRTDETPLIASGVPAGLTGMTMISGAGAPVDGVTGVGVATQGVLYLDTNNGQYYTNQGTAVAPAWHIIIQG